jgi:GH43 family beta-xylosidase
MKSHALPILCMLLALAGCQAPAASDDDAGFANPLVRQRADPHVTLHPDGWYYLTATVPEYDRIELRRARSLAELGKAEARVVWRKHASGEMGAHIWAPELHRIDGKWYLYFSAGRADKVWEIRLYVLENSAENPFEGEWIERGQLKTGWESFALDATTFAHRGQRYLSWTQVAPDGSKGTNIYLARMDGPPAVLVKHGRVLMTYSASATDANYALGLLWAQEDADLLDPAAWTKSPQPVLRSSEKTGQYGPGHNSFTTSRDGKTDILVYHARDYRDIVGEPLRDPNRHTRAKAIIWRDDGMPDFGEPVADREAAKQ